MTVNGTRSVDSYHRELGNIMWEYCGMERSEDGLKKAIDLIRSLKDDFWRNVRVLGTNESLNQSLEKAGRVADFFELGELMCIDALNRRESCGGHFRAESQTEDGEALRHDDQFAYVAAWEFAGDGRRFAAVLDARNRRGKIIKCRITLSPLGATGQPPDGVIVLMEEWAPSADGSAPKSE